ncbi:MAG TPA: VOC family protein [Gemmatimonadaceae bacterium]|nr:VOC family protein [Gemmatimonadaceae bacterium]
MTDGFALDAARGATRPSGKSPVSLPDAIRLGQVRLQVSDLAQSLEYYTSVLGLTPRETGAGSAALYVADGASPLVELVERRGIAPVRANSRLGLYHFAILLPDRAALGRFLAHLVRTGTRLGASDHLVSEALYLRDPDGLGIEVYADRPRSTWRVVNGELAMATEPLDTAGVLAAGQDAPWGGMPAGTVMGHVHLHVGDIDLASRFYHETIGLDRMVWSYPGALFLAAGGYHHHLGVNTWAGRAASASDDDARLLDWRIVLPTDAHARVVAERVEAAGYRIVRDREGWLASDPWGIDLRLVAD